MTGSPPDITAPCIISTTRVASTSVRVSSPLCLVTCTAATPRVWDSTPYKTVKRLQAAGGSRCSLPDSASVKGHSPQLTARPRLSQRSKSAKMAAEADEVPATETKCLCERLARCSYNRHTKTLPHLVKDLSICVRVITAFTTSKSSRFQDF